MNLKNGKVFTSKYVGTGPTSFEKRIYRAAVSQWLRNTAVHSGCSILTAKELDNTSTKILEKRQHTKFSRFCFLSCRSNFALNLLLFKVLNTIHMEGTLIPDGKFSLEFFLYKKVNFSCRSENRLKDFVNLFQVHPYPPYHSHILHKYVNK